MKRILILFLIATICSLSFAFGKKDKTDGTTSAGTATAGATGTLQIYSVVNDEETRALAELFTERTGIKVEYIRASTGELVNRVIAEKKSPQADVLLGGPSALHNTAASQGALASYASPVAKNFPSYTKDANGFWNGYCVLTLGIGVNTERYAQKFGNTNFPRTWDDLIDSRYNGEIVLTDPVASSTAYLFVQNQLQRLGEARGWEYLLKLTPLVGQFPSSGGAPPKLVGTGEYALCVAYVHALAKYKAEGFPVTIIAPPLSAGEVDAVSVIKNAPHEENARKFIDFLLGKEAQTLFSKLSYTIPVNAAATIAEGVVPIESVELLDYDAELAGKQRDEVLLRWQREVQ